MKKTVKSTIAIILAAIMLMGIVPIGAINLAPKASAKTIEEYNVGDIIPFGSYPQSKVTNSSLISALETKSSSYLWVDYGYYSGTGDNDDGNMKPVDNMMRYKDIPYGGNLYRAVEINQYRPYCTGITSSASNSYQDDNGYYTDIVYYFKYEPLTWRVLDANEGLVMCNNVIDSQAYNNYFYYRGNDDFYGDSSKSYNASDYGKSSIRDWLNKDFYNTAFSTSQQSKIKGNQTIDAKSTYHSSCDGTTTYDNSVFLLSYWDVLNTSYGFSSSNYTYDTARKIKSTDYAKCQGCKTSSYNDSEGNSNWSLRSPHKSGSMSLVIYDGRTNYDYYYMVNYAERGVVPAFKFNPKSTISEEETETIDEKYYIKKHIDFVNSDVYKTMMNKRYAESIWEQYYSSNTQACAEFAHDVLEGGYECISFKALSNGLSSVANTYDTILLDMIMSSEYGKCVNKSVDLKIELKSAELLKDIIKVSGTTDDWLDGLDVGKELKELFVLKSENKDYSSNSFFKLLSSNMKDVNKTKLNSVFSKFSYFSNVLDYVNDGLAVINYLLDCMQYISAVEAYKASAKEFKDVLNEVGAFMTSCESNEYAEKFNEALSHFSSLTDDAEIEKEVLNHIGKEGIKTTISLCLDVAQAITLKCLTTGFKLTKEMASKVVAGFWAYEIGWNLSNWITHNDEAVQQRRLMRANYWLEDAIYKVQNKKRISLLTNKDYNSARLFHESYNLMRFSEIYSLDAHIKYLQCRTVSVGQIMTKLDMCISAELAKHAWEKVVCCVNDESGVIYSGSYYSSDYVYVACPTNVYVYKSGNLVASVVNDATTINDDNISICVYNGQKLIIADEIEQYNIRVEAYDTGTMTFCYAQSKGMFEYNSANFENINISKDNIYDFYIGGNNKDVSEASYLKNNKSKISQTSFCNHEWDEWIITKNPTSTETGSAKHTCKKCGASVQVKFANNNNNTVLELILSTESVNIKVGQSVEVTRTITNPDKIPVDVKYVIVDKTIATATANSGKFTITGVKEGKTILQVSVYEKGTTNLLSRKRIPVTVITPAKENSVSIGDIYLNYKQSTTIKPKIDVDDGVNYTVEYKSSNSSVASVGSNGNVYAGKKGSTTITCTVKGENGEVLATDTCNVTVNFSFGQWLIWILLLGFLWY